MGGKGAHDQGEGERRGKDCQKKAEGEEVSWGVAGEREGRHVEELWGWT